MFLAVGDACCRVSDSNKGDLKQKLKAQNILTNLYLNSSLLNSCSTLKKLIGSQHRKTHVPCVILIDFSVCEKTKEMD